VSAFTISLTSDAISEEIENDKVDDEKYLL
jgi:hypothetical protein